MSESIYNRLFLDSWDGSPARFPIPFTSATDVGNWYGKASVEYNEAKTYFSNHISGSTMDITRIGSGQRPHLLGADLSSMTTAQLHAIHGSISLTFDGFQYSANVDLSGAADLTEASNIVRDAFTANLTKVADITGTLQSVTVDFTGRMNGAQLFPDGSPPLQIGGIVHGAGVIDTQHYSQIIREKSGEYYAFANAAPTPTPDEAMTETYSILHTSATIPLGDRITGQGIAPLSGVIALLGQDSGGYDYLVNEAQDRALGHMNVTAPALTVDYKSIPGVTHPHDFIEVQPNGAFGFDEISTNDLSYASGPVADGLGLSQSSGAIDSPLGGFHGTFAQYMNMEVSAANDSWASFQTSEPRFDHSAELWQQSHPQYAFIPLHASTYPAGQTSPGGFEDAAHGAHWGLAAAVR